MIKINRLRLEIQTTSQDSNVFGFDIPFQSGMNIIAGANTKGKSTIGTSIYYALGMEELLGGKNEKALGKSLKTEFEIPLGSDDEYEVKRIRYSTILMEIANSKNEIVTLRRHINSGEFDANGNDTGTKKIHYYNNPLDKIGEGRSQALFLRNENNNSNEHGFYAWLANYIGIILPEVLNTSKSNGVSELYLQTIFSAAFIEQTKGWSDFMATIPYFGIPKNKQKVVEFILGLKELEISNEKEKLNKKEKEIIDNWNLTVSKLDILLAEYEATISNLPQAITADKQAISSISVFVADEEGHLKSVGKLISETSNELEGLRKVSVKKVGENKKFVRDELESLYNRQKSFMDGYNEFNQTLSLQKDQYEHLLKHQSVLEKELASQKGIQNVIDESLVIIDVFDKCPTCRQTVSSDLMANEGITLEKLSLTENITYFAGQKKILEQSIQSLKKIIDDKIIMRKYYVRKQREFEESIKISLQELIADDRDYSETDSLVRVRLENRINDLTVLSNRYEYFKLVLLELRELYADLLNEKEKLFLTVEEDTVILERFESIFKENFLMPFKYSSNRVQNIFIQKNDPFRYYPVYKSNAYDSLPQPIKTNSSASDFIRTLWAYTLTLLSIGKFHPGIVIFDEPGQHSVSNVSLKILFEKTAAIKNKQIIIFTSTEKTLTPDNGEKSEKLNLDLLIRDLKKDEDYYIYYLPSLGKSIHEI